jgi:hypothetical protein
MKTKRGSRKRRTKHAVRAEPPRILSRRTADRDPNDAPNRVQVSVPRGSLARFKLATLRLTAEVVEILNALSCVAYRKKQRIFQSLSLATWAT